MVACLEDMPEALLIGVFEGEGGDCLFKVICILLLFKLHVSQDSSFVGGGVSIQHTTSFKSIPQESYWIVFELTRHLQSSVSFKRAVASKESIT